MRIELAALVSVWLLTGCIGLNHSRDVRSISRELSLPLSPSNYAGDVEVESSETVRELLRQPLNGDRAVQIAFQNNRELRARVRELGVTRGEAAHRGALANPSFEIEILPERNSDLELRAEYNITSLLFAPMRQNAGASEVEAQRHRVAAAVLRLGYRARAAYLDLAFAQKEFLLLQQNLDSFAAAKDAAEALLAAGNINALEASLQRSAFERARIQAAEGELRVATSRERFARALGLAGNDLNFRLDNESLRVPDALTFEENVEAQALERNYELLAMRHSLSALAQETGIARTEGWLPDISVDVHALTGNPDDSRTNADLRFGGGVSFSVPLFYQGEGRTHALESRFDAAMERYIGGAIDLRSSVRELRARLRSAHARAKQYQQVIVPAQNRVLEETLLQYNAMQLGIFELLGAQRASLEVEVLALRTHREYQLARAAWETLQQGALPSPSLDSSIESQGEGTRAMEISHD